MEFAHAHRRAGSSQRIHTGARATVFHLPGPRCACLTPSESCRTRRTFTRALPARCPCLSWWSFDVNSTSPRFYQAARTHLGRSLLKPKTSPPSSNPFARPLNLRHAPCWVTSPIPSQFATTEQATSGCGENQTESRRERSSPYILKLNVKFFERLADFGRVFGANQKAVGCDSGVERLLGNPEFFL